MLFLENKTKQKLGELLDIAKSNFDDMSARWDELEPKSTYVHKNSDDFVFGYVFGKIEHKFIEWFYSQYGRSQTDEEYVEFYNIASEHIKNITRFKT